MKSLQNPFDAIVTELESLKSQISLFKPAPLQKEETTNKLLTCQEVLKLFHISRPTLRRWEHDKKLIPIRVGRRMLFKQSDIDMILSKGGKNV